MLNIADRWTQFRTLHIASTAAPAQLHDLRIAFYAGFRAMLDANLEIAELDEVVAVLRLEQFHRESRRFDPNSD
jgi:hypothetical protein